MVNSRCPLWGSALVSVGSASAGLALLCVLAPLLWTDYAPRRGIVGFGSFYNVSVTWQSQVFLLGIVLVPLVTAAGYLTWERLGLRLASRGVEAPLPVAALCFVPLLWLIGPVVSYATGGRPVTRELLTGVGLSAVVAAAVAYLPRRQFKRELLRWLVIGLLPLALILVAQSSAWRYNDVDLFHEGEQLASGSAWMRGGVPFRDFVFVHGFLEDPGRAVLGRMLFGPTVESVRRLDRVFSGIGWAAFYFLALAVLRSPAAAALLALYGMQGRLAVDPTSRTMVADMALAVFAFSLDPGRSRSWHVASGLLAGLAPYLAIDTGLTAAVSTAGTAVLLLTGSDGRSRRRQVRAFFIGMAVPVFGGLLVMAVSGVLMPLIRHEVLLASSFAHAYSRPVFPPGTIEELRGLYLTPLAAAACLSSLLLSVLRKRFQATDFLLVLLAAANSVLFIRGIDRADPSHLAFAQHFAGLALVALLLKYANRGAAIAWVASGLFFVDPRAGLIFRDGKPIEQILDVTAWVDQGPQEGRRQCAVPTVGRIYISDEQATEIESLSAFIASRLPAGSTFYDFTNNGALYFLLDRPNPTRYPQVWLAVDPDQQREVISSLQAEPPPLVFYRCGKRLDALDNIDNSLRHHLISSHLLRYYRPSAAVGSWVVLDSDIGAPPDPMAVQALTAPLRAGYLPYFWAKEARTSVNGPIEVMQRFRGSRAIGSGVGIPVHTTAPWLQLTITCADAGPVDLAWRTSMGESSSVQFRLVSDSESQSYLLHMAALPGWVVLKARVGTLELMPSGSGVHGALEAVEWIR